MGIGTGSGHERTNPRLFKVTLVAAFAAIYIIWGSTYLAIRYAVETIPPFLMMGVRSVAAGIILVFLSRFRGENGLRLEHLPGIMIIGISFFVICHGLLAWAEQRIASGYAAVLLASIPLWSALIEGTATKDRVMGRIGLMAIGLGFVGILLLIVPELGTGPEEFNLMGVGAALFGSISWATGGVYSRIAKLPASPVLTAGLELIAGGSLLLMVSLLVGELRDLDVSEVQVRSVGGLMYLIVFGSVIGFTAYIWLLRVVPATQVSTYAYVNPVVAVILGSALENERLTLSTIIAFSLIVLAVYLMLYDRSRKRTEAGGDLNRSGSPLQTRFSEEAE